MIDFSYYGDMAEAMSYFAKRLHSQSWDDATSAERESALIQATRIIDAFAFKCDKTVSTQALEFPRGTDTEVPDDIKIAAFEIAINILDGRDPELELENLAVSSEGFSSVRTTYNRNQVPVEHLVNGVPSATAWRFIRPYLRDSREIKTSRVS